MIKLKNNLLFKNIIILLITGGIAKVLGMLGKIIYTRVAGINIVSLYTLITPTFMLIITITQFSFPISISKLSAEEKYKNKDLLHNAYLTGFIIDVILILIIILSAKTIAILLHAQKLYKAIVCISFIIPFITISSIQRGFLHGKENMLPASITNITEEIIKILLIVIILPISMLKGDIFAIITIILFNIITEFFSIIIMNKVINKKYLTKEKGITSKKIVNSIIAISLPTTLVRLISSIGFFLEPIILTYVLLKTNYSSTYIMMEYGIISSYIIPLLSMPTFFSISIASALLPNITKAYASQKYKEFNKKLLKLMIISILIGIICLSFILCFPKKILEIIYNINLGINYIYIIGPFFLILYMQPTLSVAIQAMNLTNKLFKISIISLLIKYSILIILGLNNFGMNSLIFALIGGIIINTSLMFFTVLINVNKKT